MRKLFFLICLTLLMIVQVCAQDVSEDFLNNSFNKKAIEYKKMAETAFADGNYTQSEKYALLSEEYSEKSKVYIERQKNKLKAESALVKANNRVSEIRSLSFKLPTMDKLNLAESKLNEVNQQIANKSYETAYNLCLEIQSTLINIESEFIQDKLKPAFYRVHYNNKRSESFWRIAENPFIYGDPTKWNLIYEANKNKLPFPDNPNLILPGTLLKIPSIDGEIREGTYQE